MGNDNELQHISLGVEKDSVVIGDIMCPIRVSIEDNGRPLVVNMLEGHLDLMKFVEREQQQSRHDCIWKQCTDFFLRDNVTDNFIAGYRLKGHGSHRGQSCRRPSRSMRGMRTRPLFS